MRLRTYLALLSPHALPLAAAAAILGATGAVPAAAVWLLKLGLSALQSGETEVLAPIVGAFVALSALQGIAMVGRAAITRRASAAIASDLRRRCTVRSSRIGGRRWRSGDRLAALTDEVDQVQYGVSALVTAVRDPIAIAGLAAVAIAMAPAIAIPTIGGMGIAFGAGTVAAGWVRRAGQRARVARAEMASLLGEQMAGVGDHRRCGCCGGGVREDRDPRRAGSDARWRLEVIRVVPSAVVQGPGGGGPRGGGAPGGAGGGGGAARGVRADRARGGGGGWRAGRSRGWREVFGLMQRSLAALDRVDRVLSAPQPDPPTGRLPEGPLEVVWDDVSVAFGERRVVDGVTIAVAPGEMVALIGPSGAGKTTLLRLAAGLIAPSGGEVRIGGCAVGGLDRGALGAAVAVVPQDGMLFARSVAENVALGEAAREDRVEAALQRAEADFVARWPQRSARVLSERGAPLSGGERQRIAIARAIYRGARVLLLDEPTANLDRATAARLLGTLRALSRDRVVVVATHDPDLVAAADRAVQIRDGSAVPMSSDAEDR